MRVAYLGNFSQTFCTESHVALAFEYNGHSVTRVQEGSIPAFDLLVNSVTDYDLVLWTRTGDLADQIGHLNQWKLIVECRRNNVPIASYHLDRWFGLSREHLIYEEPFFRTDFVITADGGNSEGWKNAGINHSWLPPGVSLSETEPGIHKKEYESDIAFCGSWQGGYHQEWTHRAELVSYLKNTFGTGVKFWPERGRPAIRGKDLRDLYASTKILVGDSCLTPHTDGAPWTHYASDRISESVTRDGGLFIHPRVKGITDGTMFQEDQHILCWDLWNWNELKSKIDWALTHDSERDIIQKYGRDHGLNYHVYEVRTNEIIDIIFNGAKPYG